MSRVRERTMATDGFMCERTPIDRNYVIMKQDLSISTEWQHTHDQLKTQHFDSYGYSSIRHRH